MEENNRKISGRLVNPRKYIELYGMFGRFDLPSKSVKVRYFSTIASGRDKRSDAYALLRELKPMRERVKASDIKDLASLLQRNLDDFRVAYELIPYLLNSKPEIAFFPAVLGVLIPNDFLTKEGNGSYPIRKIINNGENENNPISSYDDKWKIELFKFGTETSNLGILSIDLSDIDIVVLDGQHRANAFRVASGAFSEKDSSVYPAFYKDIIIQEDLNADLPITLAWFENDQREFDPRYVSRRLFVDVNNTAKKVSKSRKILLNDYEVASLLTRFYYSSIAENKSFSLETFSLFHSEFDKDSDITVSSNNVLSITNPEFIHEIFSWLTLGSRTYNSLACYRSKDIFKGNLFEFSLIFKSEEFNSKDIDPFEEFLNTRIVVIKEVSKIKNFENEYNKHLHPAIYTIFNGFNLFHKHYKACLEIGNWYNDGMNTYQRTVWEEVFCGGEGLYYTFKNKEIKGKVNAALTNYLAAIDEIEKKFKTFRAKYFSGVVEKDVNSAFDSANTKAFQVGLFMAFDVFKEDKSFIDGYEDFLTQLNSVNENSWIVILNEIRSVLIKGVDPKQWPAYQKLILRVIQRDGRFFYNNDNFSESPDGVIFEYYLLRSFNAWWETQDEVSEVDLNIELISEDNIRKWAKNSKDAVDELFSRASIQPIVGVDINAIAFSIIIPIVNRINPPNS